MLEKSIQASKRVRRNDDVSSKAVLSAVFVFPLRKRQEDL